MGAAALLSGAADRDVLRTSGIIAGLLAALLSASPMAAGDKPDFRLLKIDGRPLKWGAAQMGQGVTVTFAVATESSAAAGTVNCRTTTGINGLLERSKLQREAFDQALSTAFRMWSDVADIHFVAAAPDQTADLVIAAEAEPQGIAFADVTLTSPVPAQIGTIGKGVICLNPEVRWTLDHPDDGNEYRLYYVLAHEIGHAIGLDHPGPSGALMSFEYSRTVQALQPGDRAGAISLYGAARGAPLALHALMH